MRFFPLFALAVAAAACSSTTGNDAASSQAVNTSHCTEHPRRLAASAERLARANALAADFAAARPNTSVRIHPQLGTVTSLKTELPFVVPAGGTACSAGVDALLALAAETPALFDFAPSGWKTICTAPGSSGIFVAGLTRDTFAGYPAADGQIFDEINVRIDPQRGLVLGFDGVTLPGTLSTPSLDACIASTPADATTSAFRSELPYYTSFGTSMYRVQPGDTVTITGPRSAIVPETTDGGLVWEAKITVAPEHLTQELLESSSVCIDATGAKSVSWTALFDTVYDELIYVHPTCSGISG